jgi:hypothetical protein
MSIDIDVTSIMAGLGVQRKIMSQIPKYAAKEE